MSLYYIKVFSVTGEDDQKRHEECRLLHSSSQDGVEIHSSSQDGVELHSSSQDGVELHSSSQDGVELHSSSQIVKSQIVHVYLYRAHLVVMGTIAL